MKAIRWKVTVCTFKSETASEIRKGLFGSHPVEQQSLVYKQNVSGSFLQPTISKRHGGRLERATFCATF